MDGKRFIRQIRLRNLLSYGDAEDQWLKLEPLNVLIGANGSGKSNLIGAISLLKACPEDLGKPFGPGGIQEWIWKGSPARHEAEIEMDIDDAARGTLLRYEIVFTERERKQYILRESLTRPEPDCVPGGTAFEPLYGFEGGVGVIQARNPEQGNSHNSNTKINGYDRLFKITNDSIKYNQSIFSQTRESQLFPELTWLGGELSRIRIYWGWGTAAYSSLRKPVGTDLDRDFLLEDASNLALILEDLLTRGLKPTIIEHLQRFFEPVTDITTTRIGGLIQFHLHERGLEKPIPSARLSDGTLQFLILLAILCHPEPPPLICIEEPEVGLHPDIIPMVGELLIETAARTQLIVTTHSADLISALGEVPEAVVVCERPFDDGTTLKRLDPEKMKKWLEDYTLGHVWATGEIGGNRW